MIAPFMFLVSCVTTLPPLTVVILSEEKTCWFTGFTVSYTRVRSIGLE